MPLSETDLKQIKAEAKEWTKNFGTGITPHLEEEAYTVGATAQAEKHQNEVEELKAGKAAFKDAADKFKKCYLMYLIMLVRLTRVVFIGRLVIKPSQPIAKLNPR